MTDAVIFFVDCLFDGRIARSYDFPHPIPLSGDFHPPPQSQLINDAKDNLMTEHLAAPPFEGWTFRVRRIEIRGAQWGTLDIDRHAIAFCFRLTGTLRATRLCVFLHLP